MSSADIHRIDEEAARWVARLDGGTLTGDDRLELDAWLSVPEHRDSYERHRESWDDASDTLRTLSQIPQIEDSAPRRRIRFSHVGAAIGLAAALAVAALGILPRWRSTQTLATVRLQRSSFTFSDGSRAELNAQTSLSTDFSRGERLVRITDGEVYFEVARDPARPFRVETPTGTIAVLGTSFNVRIGAGGPEVTLLDGSIAVERKGGAATTLVPGQQLAADGSVRVLTSRELEAATAWRQGRIVLNGLTLAEAAGRFSTYHGTGIHVATEVAGLKLGGSYPLDNLQGFFRLIEDDTLGLRVLNRGDGSYAIVPERSKTRD